MWVFFLLVFFLLDQFDIKQFLFEQPQGLCECYNLHMSHPQIQPRFSIDIVFVDG